MKTKQVYLWVAINEGNIKDVSADLYFSSPEKFVQLLGSTKKLPQLFPVEVPECFDDMDYIPDNY